MDPLIGEIRLFAGNFAPRGWALCDGQLLPISQNQALFAILGTTYGGDGRTTFALPDLRGRVPIHAGAGPGLSPHLLGAKGGKEKAGTRLPASISAASGKDVTALSGGKSRGLTFDTMPPYLSLNYIIALQGVFPSRN